MITGQTGEDLALLPLDSELVAGINFNVLKASKIWKDFVAPKLIENMTRVAEFKTKCGFDPLDTVVSVSASVKNLGGSGRPDIAVVVHGPDKAKVMNCLVQMKEKAEADGGSITIDGDTAVLTAKNNQSVAMTFVNDNTMVVMGPNGSKDSVKALAAGGSALKSSPKFVEMYGKINSGATIWGLANGEMKLLKAFPLAKILAVYGSLNVDDGLTADMRVRLETPESAKSLSDLANSQAKQAAGMVDSYEITVEDSDVHLKSTASLSKIMALGALFAGGRHGQ